MYATNDLISHPLVSPILQPTLGGLPPLLIMTGGGEVLRDEQIYLAHKCANPNAYLPPERFMNEKAAAQLKQYKATDVQLQVWDDLCHVAPTLSFTRPAKYMFRSVAQFSAWALARAQKTGIEILDDDAISIISTSSSEDGGTDNVDVNGQSTTTPTNNSTQVNGKPSRRLSTLSTGQVGKAGDPLPPFRGHMIRQRVTRHGDIFHLAPAHSLEGCTVPREEIGTIKIGPVQRWLKAHKRWDERYLSAASRVRKRRERDLVAGYEGFGDNELPPPSALAGRRKVGAVMKEERKKKSMGMALWSLWGSKHDEQAVTREERAEQEPETKAVTSAEGKGARPFVDIQNQESAPPAVMASRSRSRRRTVVDENQTDGDGDTGIDENTSIAQLLAIRQKRDEEKEKAEDEVPGKKTDHLTVPPNTGVTGKRPTVDGISVPFTLKKEADTASMKTLTSAIETRSVAQSLAGEGPSTSSDARDPEKQPPLVKETQPTKPTETEKEKERPGLDTFVTAPEVPIVGGKAPAS
jgi:hypothetical protein